MDSSPTNSDQAMMLDGNAAAGILSEIFTIEITSSSAECANCGHEGEMGTLLAFMQAPGVVLRCPVCKEIILRVVQSPSTIYLDMRGAVYVALSRANSG